METIENVIAPTVKAVKKTKVNKSLNKETTKVLNVIVKNAGLTATKIQKKLRWAFIPTRALGFLRKNKFVLVNKKDKTYTVSAAGTAALVKPAKTPKTPKAVKVVAPVIVVAEPVTIEPVMELIAA